MSTLQYMREIISDRMQYFTPKIEDKKSQEPEPYQNLQKSSVLLEARCFNEAQIQDRKCRQILAKLIYLINQGEVFNETETQSLFFGVTKLFQSNNQDLRRMIYLMIKEFRHENSMYVVISSLTKDITSKSDLFRMNALRTIPLVLDPSNLVQLERYLKNAILDKAQPISSAALLAGLQIFRLSPDFVRKWANEVAERLNSKYPQNSFHALCLLHEIKNNDKVTFTKILMQLTKETLVPIANMQIIRFIKEILPDVDTQYEKLFVDYLLKQIHKSKEIVIFEACKALGEIKSLSNKDLQPMVQVISVFLASSSVINKFVALKILNRLIANPIRRSLITSTSPIEALLQDSNKSLAALAVSILLKVCQEGSIEKLLSQIFEFLGEMSDEFKIDVLRSVKALALNSGKWKPIVAFLQQTFKCDASQDFKRYAVEIIETLIKELPDAREAATLALAEYIEDCPYQSVQLQVLSIINREASKAVCPTKVIRMINNRLYLEEAEVRAAAVAVLGKFMLNYPQERARVKQLLQVAAANDPDEEVRSRSAYYIGAGAEQAETVNLNELDVIEAYLSNNLKQITESRDETILEMAKILEFAETNKGKIKKSEVIQHVVEEELVEAQHYEEHDLGVEVYRKLFRENQAFKEYGTLRKSVPGQQLTDNKSEYIVSVVKHFFDNHIILEYKIKNTLENVALSDVSVELTIKNPNLQFERVVPAKKIESGCASNIFVGLVFNPNLRLVSSTIQTILTFTVNENAATYQDEYQIEDLHINYNDFLGPEGMNNRKFQADWEQLSPELSQSYKLDYKNTDIAIKELARHFGLQICEGSDTIQPSQKFHTLLLGGSYLATQQVLVICQIGFQQGIGCVTKIRCKSGDPVLTANVVESLA